MQNLENPFPGMNPYLESSLLWRGHHALLINFINVELNQVLPPEFSSRMEERVYIEEWNKEYVADNAAVLTRSIAGPQGSVALLERTAHEATVIDQPLLLSIAPRTMRELFIEIRTRDDDAELISVIELLSPTNKEPGPGREEYKRKQNDLMLSSAHLMEIDLLRTGLFALAPDEKRTRERAGNYDYLVSLHRAGTGANFHLWPIRLRDRLPRVAVPLIDGLHDVALDLQMVVNRAYREGGVGRYIHYERPCNPPLSAVETEWAKGILREHGCLPAIHGCLPAIKGI